MISNLKSFQNQLPSFSIQVKVQNLPKSILFSTFYPTFPSPPLNKIIAKQISGDKQDGIINEKSTGARRSHTKKKLNHQQSD